MRPLIFFIETPCTIRTVIVRGINYSIFDWDSDGSVGVLIMIPIDLSEFD